MTPRPHAFYAQSGITLALCAALALPSHDVRAANSPLAIGQTNAPPAGHELFATPSTDRYTLGNGLSLGGDSRALEMLRLFTPDTLTGGMDHRLAMPFSITGPIAPNLFVDASTSDDPSAATRWRMTYTGGRTKVDFGDVPVSFVGNDFVTFNRTVQGLVVEAALPNNGQLHGVLSSLQSQMQTDTLTGDFSSGPYLLGYSPITPGSETVTLNGRTLTRDDDYTVENRKGQITLRRGVTLTPADRMMVRYEVMAGGVGGGTLLALRGSYPVGKTLTAGVSHLSYAPTYHADNAYDLVVDRFTGSNVTGPFTLTRRPNRDSETVTVNGVPQRRNFDYTLESGITLRFTTRATPVAGAAIEVRYNTPRDTIAQEARSVTGVDLQWKAGHGVTFDFDGAASSGARQGQDGTALSAGMGYQSSQLNATARYKNASPNFMPFDAPSIQTQRGTDWSVNYTPSSALTLQTTGENRITSTQTTVTSAGNLQDEQQRQYTIDWHQPGMPTATLQHYTFSAHDVNTPDQGSDTTSDRLALGWNKGAYSAGFSLERTENAGQLTVAKPGPPGMPNSMITTASSNRADHAQVHVGYQPNERMEVRMFAGASRTLTQRDGVEVTTDGTQFQTSATYRPMAQLTVSADLLASTTKPVVTNGGPWPGSSTQAMTLRADWQPNSKFTLGTRYLTDLYTDDSFGTSGNRLLTSSATWLPGRAITLNGYGASLWHHEPGAPLPTSNMLFGLTASFAPIQRTQISLGAHRLAGGDSAGASALWGLEGNRMGMNLLADFGGLPYGSTSMLLYTGGVNYRVSDRQELLLTGEAAHGAGVARDALGVGWRYFANERRTFMLGARTIRADEGGGDPVMSHEVNAQMTWEF